MSVKVYRLARAGQRQPPTSRQLSDSDKSLLCLHRNGLLTRKVNYQGPLHPQRYVNLDRSLRSRLETDLLVSILGERCKLGEDRFLQVPSHLEPLRDRLFYLLLAEVDEEAAEGNLSDCDYRIDRGKTTLLFFNEQRKVVVLIPGGEIDVEALPDVAPPDLNNPQIEVASLLNQRDVTVLDAGIGRSTTINSLMRRLQELGKQVKGYGLNLTEEISPAGSAVPIFTGKFEDFPFPIGFDLVYSQVGSSFYTPNIPKYIRKLKSILSPGGVALLDIANFHLWRPVLTDAGMNFSPLFNINRASWAGDLKLIDPAGLLIRMP